MKHRPFSFLRVAAITGNTFTELVRLKVFYFLLIFALLLIANSLFMARLSFQQEFQVLKDVSLGAMNIFSSLLAIVATAQLIPRDLEDRTIYTILAKPVPRHEYLMGKLAGVLLLVGCERAEPVAERLSLAVDEAATNVLEHAYKGATDREVELRFEDRGPDFRVELVDTGQMVDPRAVPHVDLDKFVTERRTGGLGMHLMEKIMDSVTFRRSARRNVCALVKHKDKADEESPGR